MTFSGDLQGISLADVFQSIAANRGSGTLHVRWRRCERFVGFVDGAVAGIGLGPRKPVPILDHLCDRGWVDPRRAQRLLARRRRSRKTPCRLLLEARLIDEDRLRDAFVQWIAETVYDLLLLENARFSFTEGPLDTATFGADQKALAIRLDPGALLVEGLRRRDEWERIHRIVGSERDLFVLLEGWEEADLDPRAQEVAPFLDGRTDLAAIVSELRADRFEVLRAVAALVRAGVARPCTTEELEGLAEEAVREGAADEAARLLGVAVERERSNRDLRRRLAELLEGLGRFADAAAEYAQMGYHAVREGAIDEALEHYDRAVELQADDPALHERRIEVLREHGDDDRLAGALVDLSRKLCEIGLAGRASATLREVASARGLEERGDVLEALAAAEVAAGRPEDGAAALARLADLTVSRDEARAIEALRRAVELAPADEKLAARLADLESGRSRRRRRRRRMLAIGAAAAMVVAGVIGVLAGEMLAARAMAAALARGLGPQEAGAGVAALRALRAAERRYAWTASMAPAEELAARMRGLQLAAVRRSLARGNHGLAGRLLVELADVEDGPDLTALAALVFLETDDRELLKAMREILERAPLHRRQGGDGSWVGIYPRLERAAGEPARRWKARLALSLLRGDRLDG